MFENKVEIYMLLLTKNFGVFLVVSGGVGMVTPCVKPPKGFLGKRYRSDLPPSMRSKKPVFM